MRNDGISEIDRHLKKTRAAVDSLKSEADSQGLRNSWEEYLHSFHRAIGRLISFALRNTETKVWGHKLKNNSTRDDEGLAFLREARAHAEHGLSPVAEFLDPRVTVGGNIFSFGGNSSVTFTGNTVNGVPMGDFHLQTQDGKVSTVLGSPNVSIVEKPAEIKLTEVVSDQKGITFPIPKSILDKKLAMGDPIQLAEFSLEVLEQLMNEYRSHF